MIKRRENVLYWGVGVLILIFLYLGIRLSMCDTGPGLEYQVGYECGVIVAKMDILTDDVSEYKRLSDKYIMLGCQGPAIDGIDEKLYIQEM